MQIEYVVPCHFGLEAVLKRETGISVMSFTGGGRKGILLRG